MKARSIWPAALLALSVAGCSSGSVGPGALGANGGSGSSTSASGAGGSSGLPAGCTACTQLDGGYVQLADGAIVSDDAFAPAASGSAASGGAGSGAASSGSGIPTGNPVVAQPLWRLANAEYSNTLHDLLGIDTTTIPPLDPDAPSGGFRVGGPTSGGTVRAYHDAAVYIAAQAVANMPGLMAAVGCAANAGSTCFIPAFAQKAYRRSFDATTQAAIQAGLTGVYTTISAAPGGSTTLALQAVVESVLQSPNFLYHLEIEEQAKGPGQVAVANYSMANRLSYLLWASMPDSMSISKAAAGTLSTPAQIQAEAARMLADPKAHLGLRNFYEQWLTVLDMPLTKAGAAAAIYTPAVQAAMRTSLDMQVDDALWAPTGAVKALLSGSSAYVNATLAPIFGTPTAGPAMTKVTLDPTQRAGIVTHPALMTTYAIDTTSHPIKRGRFMWEQLLCEPFPDPPTTTPIGPPTFQTPKAGQSLRQDFEILTRGTLAPNPPDMGHQAYCMPCHTRLNDLGFVFENYDTIGRYRTIDDYGQPVKTSDLHLIGASDPALVMAPIPSPVQFAAVLAANDTQVQQCLTTQVYRYMAKRDDTTADIAAINTLGGAFAQSQESMTQLLSALTQADVFLYRMNVQ